MARNQPTPVCVIDLSTVRFRAGPAGRGVALLTAAGDVLATGAAGAPERSLAFDLLEDALHGPGLVLRARSGRSRVHQVGWYNPYTHQVTTACAGGTITVGDGEPLALPTRGEVALLSASGLELGAGRTLPVLTPSLKRLRRDQAAHHAAA